MKEQDKAEITVEKLHEYDMLLIECERFCPLCLQAVADKQLELIRKLNGR